jgi:four helix bundle protein
MQDYRKLKVWEKAHAFAVDVHRACEVMPRRSGVALTGQLRRAALSISANIVEGTAKDSQAELRRFLIIALGSAAESDYHLLVARDTGLLEPAAHENLSAQVIEIRRMLSGLIKRVAFSIGENALDRSPFVPKHSSHEDATESDLETPNLSLH